MKIKSKASKLKFTIYTLRKTIRGSKNNGGSYRLVKLKVKNITLLRYLWLSNSGFSFQHWLVTRPYPGTFTMLSNLYRDFCMYGFGHLSQAYALKYLQASESKTLQYFRYTLKNRHIIISSSFPPYLNGNCCKILTIFPWAQPFRAQFSVAYTYF